MADMTNHAPISMSTAHRWPTWIVAGVLVALTMISSIGWFLSAHEGRGVPPECYTLENPSLIRFDAIHGNDTSRASFVVAESSSEVMLGYWQDEDAGDGLHTLEGYESSLTYLLRDPLGERQVVDPAGDPIPPC